MKIADLDRIETRLGIALPSGYREYMSTRADALGGITFEVQGESRRWFEELLYLEADRLIEANLFERDPCAGTEEAFPNWSKTFVLIGTYGDGNYVCLRLIGDEKVWMIGSDCSLEPTVEYDSLADYVDAEIRRHAETPPWRPEPVLSSFDESCPLERRIAFYIHDPNTCIQPQDSDRPLTEEKLLQHGIDTQEIRACVAQIVAVLQGCDPGAIKAEMGDGQSEYGLLPMDIIHAPNAKVRFEGVAANIAKGFISVSLYGPKDKAPPPDEVGVDWVAFRSAVSRLLRCVAPRGTEVEVTDELTGGFNTHEQWNYNFGYKMSPPSRC